MRLKSDERLTEDIVEKVNEPTVWLSPVHIVRSPEKVRVVVEWWCSGAGSRCSAAIRARERQVRRCA